MELPPFYFSNMIKAICAHAFVLYLILFFSFLLTHALKVILCFLGTKKIVSYLHDGLSKILGAPITQAGLEGGTNVIPVSTRVIPVLCGLDKTRQ